MPRIHALMLPPVPVLLQVIVRPVGLCLKLDEPQSVKSQLNRDTVKRARIGSNLSHLHPRNGRVKPTTVYHVVPSTRQRHVPDSSAAFELDDVTSQIPPAMYLRILASKMLTAILISSDHARNRIETLRVNKRFDPNCVAQLPMRRDHRP